MSNVFGSINLLSSGNKLELYCPPGLPAGGYSIAFPPKAPENGQILKYNASSQQLEWGAAVTQSALSLSVSVPTPELSVSGIPYTGGTGEIGIDWKNQEPGLIFAAPSGSSGRPVFRKITDTDLPERVSGSKVNGLIPKASIPAGTNALNFQLDSENSGVIIQSSAEGLRVIKQDNSLADVYCKKLYVTEGIDAVNTTTVSLGDAVLRLLAEAKGAPVANAGIAINRGSSTSSTFQWNETTDAFEAGVDDNIKPLARKSQVMISQADLTTGSYVFNHNLRERYPAIAIADNNNALIMTEVNYTSVNSLTINFSRLAPLTGNWVITAIG